MISFADQKERFQVPYIKGDMRPPYDAVIAEVIKGSDSESWKARTVALITEVVRGIYGGAEDTRYFKQNEALGVFYAAALECSRRLEDGFPFNIAELRDIKGTIPEITEFCDRVTSIIPKDDETQRAGHLNYFVTELTLAGVQAGWLPSEKAPCFIASIGAYWYQRVTGPYEDGAIKNNGDTSGYETLVTARDR